MVDWRKNKMLKGIPKMKGLLLHLGLGIIEISNLNKNILLDQYQKNLSYE